MPTTYLLLRNNKQTGPFSLEELLQHSLKPQDLIWIEGRSAGWTYPADIDALKPYLTDPSVQRQQQPNPALQAKPVMEQPAKTSKTGATHIYVSLPAGRQTEPAAELPSENLEAKAEALYQRVQAFAEGKTTDSDARYARSLKDMKGEYNAWQVTQQKKKKNGSTKRRLAIAALVLIATTSFGISKWIGKNSVQKQAPQDYTLQTVTTVEEKQPTSVSFNAATDSSAAPVNTGLLAPNDPVVKEATPQKNAVKTSESKKKATTPKQNPAPVVAADTSSKVAMLKSEPAKPALPEVIKKTVPLSQLVTINGDFDKSAGEAKVVLQNNSPETLKSVAVTILYLKKEDRVLSKETIYFYNVQPGSNPAITASGSRRATAARFEIGTITRADGSLYLIH